MTFLDTSNRLDVKHTQKKNFTTRWRHLAARFESKNIELPQLVGVGVMTFLDISNRSALKHKKKRISPLLAPHSVEIL